MQEDRWIRLGLDQARQYQLEYILSQDVFFHDREQKCISDLLQAIRRNRRLAACQADYFPNAERCLHPARELERLFSPIPGFERALGLSRELNRACEFSLDQLGYRYPREIISYAVWLGVSDILVQCL